MMKKVNLMKTFLAAMTIVLAFGVYSCTDESSMIDSQGSSDLTESLSSDFYNPPAMGDEMCDFVDGTMQSEMYCEEGGNFSSMMLNGRDDNNGKKKQWNGRRFNKGLRLGAIFLDMDMTNEQLLSVRELLTAFFECRHNLYSDKLDEKRAIMIEGNELRRDVSKQYRDGEITKEEAREQIAAINENVRQQLQELYDLEAYCECQNTLLENIRALLTEEQQVLWDEWIAEQEGPCFDEE